MSSQQQRGEQDIADLIGDIKKSYIKSNMVDISIDSLSEASTAKRLGYLLKRSTNLSNKDFSMNFDPLEAELLRKMVSDETVQRRVVLRAEDYFKGIIFIDYFTTVLTHNGGFIDELFEISKEFERINPLLDPDMETLVKYAGISYVATMGRDYLLSRNVSQDSNQKFVEHNYMIDESYLGLRKLDSFYGSLGQKLFSMLSHPDIIQRSSRFKGLNDFRALMFIDCLMPHIENNEARSEILGLLDHDNYYKASFRAMATFSREASSKSLDEYIHSVAEKNRNIDMNTI